MDDHMDDHANDTIETNETSVTDRATDRALESRVRRAAAKHGYRLEKGREASASLDNYGAYMLVEGPAYSPSRDNWRSRTPVFGFRYDATLEEIMVWLKA